MGGRSESPELTEAIKEGFTQSNNMSSAFDHDSNADRPLVRTAGGKA